VSSRLPRRYLPALCPGTGVLEHAAELPTSPTLCGLHTRWIAPHDQWPGLGAVCGQCLAIAQHHQDLEQIVAAGPQETPS